METITQYALWRQPALDSTARLVRHINGALAKEFADFELSYTVEIALPEHLNVTLKDLELLNIMARKGGWDGGVAMTVLEDGKTYLLFMAARVMVHYDKGMELMEEEYPAFQPKGLVVGHIAVP